MDNWTPEHWYLEAKRTAEVDADRITRMAQFGLQTLERLLPGKSREAIVADLVQSNLKRINAVPNLREFPELIGVRELVLAEWEGVRDGARLDECAWAVHCDAGFYRKHVQAESQADREQSGRCTYVFFPDSDHGPIMANNLDSSPAEPFGEPPWRGINEHLFFGRVSSGIFLDEDQEPFPVPIEKLMARYCRSVPEAAELLERYTAFWGPCNAILVDRSFRVAMIEKSARRIAVRYSDNGFGFVTSMTAVDPKFRSFLDDRRAASLVARGLPPDCADVHYWAAADRRRELLAELIRDQVHNPTFESLRSIIQHRSDRGLVAMHGDPLPGGGQTGYTLRTTIWFLREGRAIWWPMENEIPSFRAKPREAFYPTAFRWT